MNQRTSENTSPREKLAYPVAVSFSVAAGTLLLQLIHTRIYGVVFWNHLVYFIISIALLGFGISGTWLSFGRDTWLARRLTLRVAALGFVVSALFSSLIVPQAGVSIAYLFHSPAKTFQLFFTYSFAVLPYFFGGWMLGIVFRDYVRHIHKIYFADLLGAGLGCLFFLAAIQPAGAVILLALTCAVTSLPVLIYERRAPLGAAFLWGTLIVLAGVIAGSGFLNRTIQPEPTKAFQLFFASEAGEVSQRVHEFSEWNSISRIDVTYSADQPEVRKVFIDGDAWTGLIHASALPPTPFNPDGEDMGANRVPYFFRQGEIGAALVIGAGGGIDVYMALRGGADTVDAVEINPTTHRLLLDEYLEHSGGLIHYPGVRAYNEEGRSFVSRSDQRYDVIMMHAIDTFAALNAGAYVLSENYLYTVEAITDYVERLSDDGLLCISRWMHEAEAPRLFNVCLEALYELGFENPESHILYHTLTDQATVLISRAPFDPNRVDAFRAHVERIGGAILFPLDGRAPSSEAAVWMAGYADARRTDSERAFLADLPLDVSAVYDDSPFFFHFDKPANMMRILSERSINDFIRGHWPSFTLFSLLGFTAIAVAGFMMAPLMGRGRPPVPRFGLWLVYFACLGVAFIFVEIALMQRFALLLGHPARSLALVLAALLIAAGVGSWLRSLLTIRLPVLLTLLAGLILLAAYAYPYIIEVALGWSLAARSVLTVALVTPLGVLMGMPFPTGLQQVARHGEAAVPWMWGVNGGTTVLGSILAIIIAIWGSFTLVFVIAAAGYAVAAMLFARVEH